MSQSAASPALPPLHSKKETGNHGAGSSGGGALHGNHATPDAANRTASPAAAAADAGVGGSPVDYVALYRQYCAEEGCKANSAFVRYIQDRGGHFSLERLNLGHNYLGSKGLRPVLRMIDLCQTIVSINLEDNGIDNDAVTDLCAVLERHLSITALNLRRNPISVLGGKRLLQLAENNERITEMLLDETDIFEGLQDRIRMTLAHNTAVTRGTGPQLEANKTSAVTAAASGKPGSAASAALPPPLPPAAAAAAHLQTRSKTLSAFKNSSAALADGVASPNGGGGGGGRSGSASAAPPRASLQPAVTEASSPLRTRAAVQQPQQPTDSAAAHHPAHASPAAPLRAGWQEATVGRTQPRPPPPAVAPHSSKALPMSKVNDLRALFAERARLHTEVNRGEASRRAYAVREELQALERHGRPVADTPLGGQTYPGANAVTRAATATSIPLLPPLPMDAAVGSDTTGRRPRPTTGADGCSSNAPAEAEAQPSAAAAPTVQPPGGDDWVAGGGGGGGGAVALKRQLSSTQIDTAGAEGNAADGAHGGAEGSKGQLREAGEGGSGGAVSSRPSSAQRTRPQAHTVEDILTPSRMMLLTTEEQFTVLFDQGCREYMNRNLDAAYMAWNEAMRLAVSEGQREWMAVVASNLQRLSYELLVEEGAVHLERGDLQQAGDTFNLALEVATKAKNAAWQRDMRLAKQNVQKALFHRCHEAALLLFSRVQEEARDGAATAAANGAVTEDDYFVLPGSDEIVRHTPAFVREWSSLLLVREAVGLWGEATRVVGRLSEAAGAPLRDSVAEALNLVAGFLVQRHFNTAAQEGLLWFHTDAFLYHECVLLSELWYTLVADSEQMLRHPLLSAVCASQLGELYVATFQLPQALVQLTKVTRYGSQHKCPVMEAVGLTLCGRVHLLRANYALAESALQSALSLWSTIQSDPAVRRLMDSSTAWPASQTAAATPMDVAAVSAEMATATAAADSTTTTMQEREKAAHSARKGQSGAEAAAAHGAPRFRIEAHLPPDAIAVLASACQHYRVCLLLQTYRYRDALEALELGLNVAYRDTLHEKLRRNYHLNPSLDEIAAIAGVLQSSLVFYTLTSRYDWSVAQSAYQVEECLNIWVLAESREVRFVEVNLTKDFKCTLRELVGSLRQRLCVEPEMLPQSDAMITELPSRSWQEPLRLLYQVCIHPIIGYLRAADPQLLSGDGVITVVPTGQLWLVPFHALLNVKAGDRYLVEEVAVQLAFSATQAAFAALSATRVQQRDMHREVVAVLADADRTVVGPLSLNTAFPVNVDRSIREGEAVAAILRAGQAQVAERQSRRNPRETAAVLTHRVEVVETMEALRAVLPRARTLHFSTATTAAAAPPSLLAAAAEVDAAATAAVVRGRQRTEEEGALLMTSASPMADVDALRASEVAHLELFAEHVVLTDTNISRHHVSGIRDDVLGLVRGFFGSGVPCVIAGQWCTPDMSPIQVFQRFYSLWCRPATGASKSCSTSSSARTSVDAGTAQEEEAAPHSQGGEEGERRASGASTAVKSEASNESRRVSAARSVAGGSAAAVEEEGDAVRHRAVLLARAIRLLLVEEPASRYEPQVWAGYYCMGTGC